MTRTPEEDAEFKAKMKLSEWGYTSGDVIDYENALAMLKEVILQNSK